MKKKKYPMFGKYMVIRNKENGQIMKWEKINFKDTNIKLERECK